MHARPSRLAHASSKVERKFHRFLHHLRQLERGASRSERQRGGVALDADDFGSLLMRAAPVLYPHYLLFFARLDKDCDQQVRSATASHGVQHV
jgi:hypothetical protein